MLQESRGSGSFNLHTKLRSCLGISHTYLWYLPVGSAFGSSFKEKAPNLGCLGDFVGEAISLSPVAGESSLGGEWRVRNDSPYCSFW